MRITVSLPDPDAEFLKRYQREHNLESRSAVVAQAIKVLREAELADQYRQAYLEWQESGEDAAWESTVGDGIEDRHEAW